jgi:hypothetical protein
MIADDRSHRGREPVWQLLRVTGLTWLLTQSTGWKRCASEATEQVTMRRPATDRYDCPFPFGDSFGLVLTPSRAQRLNCARHVWL